GAAKARPSPLESVYRDLYANVGARRWCEFRGSERGGAERWSMWNEFWNERQPDRAKENSPPIHRWVLVRKPDESRQGRQSWIVVLTFSFAPPGLYRFFPRDPRLKPWAILGRPCRDSATDPQSEMPVYRSGRHPAGRRAGHLARRK